MTQATLRGALQFAGIGLHTGLRGVATVTPAEPDAGIVFVLDAPGRPGTTVKVPALAENVVDTSRATVVGRARGPAGAGQCAQALSSTA